MATISLKNVKKSFGAVEVIHDVSLDVEHGEFLALVGPSGCGKSTLLRMLAGLEAVTAGDIMIAGNKVNDLSPRERNIAMVFQSYALYPHMTVRQNMSFNLRLSRTPKVEQKKRVNEAARMLGLENLLDRKPANLSGGQRQRVAMGRAVVRHPEVFLFDEPLSNLDAKLRVQMRAEIKALHQKVRTTSVYVTHDQIEAMTLADRIVVLNGGIIEQVGRPLDLYRQPANLFVAGFIGSPAMNFIDAEIVQKDDAVIGHCIDGNDVVLPATYAKNAGQTVTLGFRPEDFALGEGSIQGRVVMVEPTGAQTLVSVSTGPADQPFLAVVDAADEFDIDEAVTAYIPPEKVHVFDAKSGRRL
ncbi:ABC transporter ATP-binding protein [Martelella mediterranea]|uniref:Carbohydrate ABC transporter ATP-binding protein (CUT1 family) n=1 Tax=Martelella mediterranea TaxID=293089 RepID=A0A4R3NJR6_9HYPH|nr:sn-glycerol-3-phosphate ABC transporter ATP-binding protein UgpC [Martelella mediterranea]TCT32998.1 carbohydrate ABC transporter ATP-binding protein (CUT1 family) [Martelella mediterranea]